MTALSQDKKIEYKPGVEIPVPVDGGSKIFAGANVCVNAAGFLVPGSDTAGLIYQGVSRQYVDNSLGNDGDLSAVVMRRNLVLMTTAHAITQANVGDQVFLVDDNLVDLAANVTNLIFCGVIAEYVDATHAFVDISPAIKQADVATHIADASGAHAASAISQGDAGNHFAAAEANVEAALQKLAKTIPIVIPRFTGWTKDGTAQAIAALPALEFPIPIMVKRAYVHLGTAPGADKTLALNLNGSALVEIAGTDTKGEGEALSIAIAANTDLAVAANETAGGAAENCDIILIAQVDDGE